MSFIEALVPSTHKIDPRYIDLSSVVIPISQVTNLTANLNALQAEINAIPVTPASNFSEFYALMPGDNTATIAIGAAVLFPQNGATSGSIVRSSSSQFVLPAVGVYEVAFQVSFDEAGQLAVAIGGTAVAHTVVGRATGTNQCVGHTLVTTVAVNSVLTIINHLSAAAITLTPTAGGTAAVSANLVIKQIA